MESNMRSHDDWQKTTALIAVAACLMLSIACVPLGPPIDETVSDNHYYSFLRTSVIFGQHGNCFELGCLEIEEADVQTFRPLNDMYAMDKQRAYYREDVLPEETPEAFRLAGGPYAVGSKGVYWYGKTFPVEDQETFHAVAYRIPGSKQFHYGVDDSGVYCHNEKISSRPDTFHALGRHTYFADSTNVYFMDGCEALDADPESFEFLKKSDGSYSVYARDSSTVYIVSVHHKPIEAADSETFEVLCAGVGPPHYARDRNHVYDFGKVVEGVDPGTFRIEENCG